MKYNLEKFNPDIQRGSLPLPVTRTQWKEDWNSQERKLILLDLDGTILDTAGDLGAAANTLRNQRGLKSLTTDAYRPHVSRGARGMIEVALGKKWNDPCFEELRKEFLEAYFGSLLNKTSFVPGMEEFLLTLDKRRIPWGIVTNKYQKYAKPIIEGISLLKKSCAILVCGDTTNNPKPHPEPVLYARNTLKYTGKETIYIGDDARDIQSGYNAGCWTHGVNFFGSEVEKCSITDWGCDDFSITPEELSIKLELDLAQR